MNNLKKTLTIFIVLVTFQVNAQSSWKAFKKLQPAKKSWVLLHPFKAKKAALISKEVQQVADSIKKSPLLDGLANGGQVDAFRHAYWMARLKEAIGESAARSLGKAHEKDNYRTYKKRKLEDGEIPDAIATEMDLFNNEIGISLTTYKQKTPKQGLIYKIINHILAGDLKIIKRNAAGEYITCDDEVITKASLKGKWKNDKCLVNSND